MCGKYTCFGYSCQGVDFEYVFVVLRCTVMQKSGIAFWSLVIDVELVALRKRKIMGMVNYKRCEFD